MMHREGAADIEFSDSMKLFLSSLYRESAHEEKLASMSDFAMEFDAEEVDNTNISRVSDYIKHGK